MEKHTNSHNIIINMFSDWTTIHYYWHWQCVRKYSKNWTSVTFFKIYFRNILICDWTDSPHDENK